MRFAAFGGGAKRPAEGGGDGAPCTGQGQRYIRAASCGRRRLKRALRRFLGGDPMDIGTKRERWQRTPLRLGAAR